MSKVAPGILELQQKHYPTKIKNLLSTIYFYFVTLLSVYVMGHVINFIEVVHYREHRTNLHFKKFLMI